MRISQYTDQRYLVHGDQKTYQARQRDGAHYTMGDNPRA